MTQHIKVEPGESLLSVVMTKLDKWPSQWGGYVHAAPCAGGFALWFGNNKPIALSGGGWSNIGATEAWLDRLPADYRNAIITRDKWASSSGAKVGKGLLAMLVEEMPEWQDDCGEFAAWSCDHGVSGCVVFCDSRPDMKSGQLFKQAGVWQLKSRPFDADTAVVTRSQWILAKQAQGIPDFDKVTNAGDAWAAEQARKYPAYWREIPSSWRFIDTYRINELFPVEDRSGAVLHARKKLLVPGVRTGGKAMEKDLREAVSTVECFLNK